MASPVMGAAGTFFENESSTPSFAAPADVVSGSVVVIAFYLDGADTVISALPTDFEHARGSPLQVNPGGPGGNNLIVVVWRRFTGADSGPYGFTLGASKFAAGRAFRYDGCIASGDPWDTNSGTGTAIAESGTSNVSVTPAVSMTTQHADETLVHVASNWAGGTWTPSTGFTEQMDLGFGTSTVADKAQASAGGSGSITATCTGNDKSGAWLGALLSTTGGASLNAGNAASAVAANGATLAVAAPAGNAALAVAGNAATLAVGAPAGGAAVGVGAFNASLAVAVPAGGGALAVAAAGATLAVATGAGNAALSVAAAGATLQVSTAAGGGAVGVGAFDVSLLYGTQLSAGAAAAGVGAFDVTLRLGAGLSGNAHGPLALIAGSVIVHTGTIAGAVT